MASIVIVRTLRYEALAELINNMGISLSRLVGFMGSWFVCVFVSKQLSIGQYSGYVL